MSEYTCHSGGAIGADLCWELGGIDYYVYTIAYSFKYHNTESKNKHILSDEELNEGWEHIKIADETLKRGVGYNTTPYIRNLLSRNWFQVKHSEAVFAIGQFVDKKKTKVEGGTGWAVQMGIDNKKPVFVFDQYSGSWFTYFYRENKFVKVYGIQTLPENFAGIGTRGLSKLGKEAIKEIYEYNFRK